MFDIQNYADFLLALLVFQLVPGAGTLTLLAISAREGRAAGYTVIPGMLLGDLLHMLAALAGLAALMQSTPLLFRGLQGVGAVYLCWLGLDLLRHPPQAQAANDVKPGGHLKFFRRGLAVSLTNPKVALFFLVFFPLFLQADAAPLTLLAMMVHVTLFSLLYQLLLVRAGSALAALCRQRPQLGQIGSRLAGLALIGFGVRLALANA